MRTVQTAFSEFPSKVTDQGKHHQPIINENLLIYSVFFLKDMTQALEICLKKQNFNLGIEVRQILYTK